MGAVLAAAGAGAEDAVEVTIHLTDVDDRPKINPARREVFGSTRRASTLVEISRLAIPGARIEVEAVALLPSGRRARRLTVFLGTGEDGCESPSFSSWPTRSSA